MKDIEKAEILGNQITKIEYDIRVHEKIIVGMKVTVEALEKELNIVNPKKNG